MQRHGEFDSDFARTVHSTRDNGEFHSAVNGGGPSLHITSYRGNIKLRAI
jgi:hypothetical protein